jgi:hypothetical protein
MLRTLADSQLSFFSHAYHSGPIRTVTLIEVLKVIQSGRYQPQVHWLRRILAHEDKAAYDRAKAQLPAVTFAGTFAPSRGNAHLQQHSGIVHGDLDHLDDPQSVRGALSRDPCTLYMFISPSGQGVKVGVYVPIVADDAAYKHVWNSVSVVYEQRYGVRWDGTGKDVSRLCYVSYDPLLYWNPAAECFKVLPMTSPATPPVRTSAREVHLYRDGHDYADLALRTATDMIQSAPLGARHHARLRAARLLGGYVAGGLLTEEQAYGALAQALVGHTNDLQRALKTVEDGLAYGHAHPITVEALEAERQAWLEQHRSQPPRRPGLRPPDPWEGLNTLPLRPYTGWRGMTKGVRHG